MAEYQHSVTLDFDSCHGCITCVKRCPTEAIRVRGGKAKILQDRCIDCGECIRVCPHHAKRAVTDHLAQMEGFRYTIALPAPALYGQFTNLDDAEIVLQGLLKMGFDEVYEVAAAAELISDATRLLFSQGALERPVISSACPAVLRLIRVRFPDLLDNVLPLVAPVELAARMAKRAAARRTGIPAGEIGCVFISPCPAKVTAAKNPLGSSRSEIDLVVSVGEVYPLLCSAMKKAAEDGEELAAAGRTGIGWGRSGGEAAATLHEQYLAADGIENVIRVLEDMEDEKLRGLDFVELGACSSGCVGGVLNIENPYVAATRLKRLGRYRPVSCNHLDHVIPPDAKWDREVDYLPVMRLDPNPARAMALMGRMGEVEERLRGLDCGSCGAPSCRAMAEDVVRGYNVEEGCIYLLHDKIEAVLKKLSADGIEIDIEPKKEPEKEGAL